MVKTIRNRPIGIFDSGVGGLTVLRAIEKVLPYENIVYFGDTARVPYGNKSKSTVIKFSTQSIRFLMQRKVKIVIVACNTASSLALSHLKRTTDVPVVGVIESGIKMALSVSPRGSIGVLGTRSTINSGSYEKAIRKWNTNAKIYSQSCPLFVPLAEEGIINGEIVNKVIKMYLEGMKEKKVDTVVLGCTHYPLLKDAISRYLKGVHIIDSAQAVALHIRTLLKNKGLADSSGIKGRRYFYVSDEPANFSKLAKLFLKRNIPKPEVIHV